MKLPERLPLVFLDIDDVLCMSWPYGGFDVIEAVAGRHVNPRAVYESVFISRARDALRLVHDQFEGAVRYVISSTWRQMFDRSQLSEVFRRGGLGFVADQLHDGEMWCTPCKLGRGKRIDEIAQWLDQHHGDEPFVIIDDTYSGPSLRPALDDPAHRFFGRVVLCEENIGLTAAHVGLATTALRLPVIAFAEVNSSTDRAGEPR